MIELPEDWESVAVQDIATVIRGASPRPKGDPRYYGGSVPRLMGADVTRDGKYVTPQIDFLTEEGAKLSRYMPAGTLTIVCSGEVGVPSFLAVDACIHDGFLALKNIKDGVHKDFLYYIFSRLKSRLDAAATHGGVFTNLTTTILKEFILPLPPLPEQRKIAAILGTWDEAIAQVEQLIAALKQRKKGLMQRLLTGKVRFPGFEGEWETFRLDDLFKRVQRKNREMVEDVLTISAGRGFLNQKDRFSKVIAGKNIEKYTLLKKGEFAYNKGNSKSYPQGCIYRLEKYEVAAIPNVYYSFSIKKEVDGVFFKYYFESGLLNRQLVRVINTGVRNDGLLNLNVDDFFSCSIRMPGLREQKKIGDIFHVIDFEIRKATKQLALLRMQKKGIMQRLLTGQVRVKVDS